MFMLVSDKVINALTSVIGKTRNKAILLDDLTLCMANIQVSWGIMFLDHSMIIMHLYQVIPRRQMEYTYMYVEL